MASKELTWRRYYGRICKKHPDFEGLRIVQSGGCVQCADLIAQANKKARRLADPEFRERERLSRIRRKDTSPGAKAEKARKAREYNRSNPHIMNAVQAKYKLAKKNRVPPWADLTAIREIYRQAAERGLTVDHVIPLQGELVSGLHVENNLQLLPGSVNFSKENKFSEDP